MTRNALLKEYVAEIERLKADVLAAREKNGIFFSEETWNQMTVEQELRQTEYEEARKQVDIVESQMRAVREEFEQSIALFMKTDGELKATRQRLKLTEGELATKDGELRTVKEALEEEVVVRQAHQETEGMLDGIATGLKKVVGGSLEDVEALFEKIGTRISSSVRSWLIYLSQRGRGQPSARTRKQFSHTAKPCHPKSSFLPAGLMNLSS
jgi:kinesin family member 11